MRSDPPAGGLPVHLVCIAKDPVAGRVKTRLTSQWPATVACELAEAALADTLDVLSDLQVQARTLALDGDAGRWRRPGIDVISQRGDGLDERLANAFDDAWSLRKLPVLLVGMDTPQVDVAVMTGAVEALLADGVDAVLGQAVDGGWWALGLRRPDARLLLGVPMSTPLTGEAQRDRLRSAGLHAVELPVMRDVDEPNDVLAVAALAPHTRFARLVESLVAS